MGAESNGIGERGETLVELVVSIALGGIVITAVLGSLFTSTVISRVDRVSASAETAVRSYAAALENRAYRPCTAGSSANPYTPADLAPPPLPTGLSGSVTSVRFWDGTSGSAGAAQFVATCPAGGDRGLQQLTLQVAPTDDPSAAETLVVERRRP